MPRSGLIHSSLKELGTGAGGHLFLALCTDHSIFPPGHLGRDTAHTVVLLGGFPVSALVRRLLCKRFSSIHAMTHCV